MVEFSPYSYDFHEDPYPVYRRLREEAPVYHNEKENFWALSRYEDVLAALKDVRVFSNSHGVSIDPSARGSFARAGTSFLAMDPPEHTRFRGLISRAFTPRRVSELEPRIRAIAVSYLDALAAEDRFDAINDLAGKLPMDVISEMLGVPPPDRSDLRSWADAMVHREEGVLDIPQAGRDGFLKIRRYFVEHLAKLREKSGTDLLSGLLELDAEDSDLSEDKLLSFCNLMITAGNETTTKLLGNALYWLWRNPEQRALVKANPELIPQWVEETLRFDASTQALMRLTLTDVEIGGVEIPAHQYVLLLIGSANRDPEIFDRPDEYNIQRPASEMLSFGRGVHFCMGAALARLEARVAFEEWWQRFPDYEIEPAGIQRVHSVNVRGFSVLPVRV